MKKEISRTSHDGKEFSTLQSFNIHAQLDSVLVFHDWSSIGTINGAPWLTPFTFFLFFFLPREARHRRQYLRQAVVFVFIDLYQPRGI